MPSFRTSITALAALTAAGLSPLAAAHPGESHESLVAETAKLEVFAREQTHLQKRCASHLAKRGLASRAAERRKALVDKIREERGIASHGQ